MHDSSEHIYPGDSYRLKLDKILTRTAKLIAYQGTEGRAAVYVRGPILSWDK